MEIRQLEYFVTSAEEKSFYKASEKLFTSQPAISKSIKLLENELNQTLFTRTSRGLQITPDGERLYHYAKNIIRQVDIMKNTSHDTDEVRFALASFPSKLITGVLADFYASHSSPSTNQHLRIEYQEGSVQDIIDFVYKNVCELGILYIYPKQEPAFRHILAHKNLEFVPLRESELCVYAGEHNPYYHAKDGITIKQLSELRYIRGVKDFFSVEHHFDYVSLNEMNTAYFDDRVLTNSDHFVTHLLEKTDLCCLGIHIHELDKTVKINTSDEEKKLILGYIKVKGVALSETATSFLENLSQL